MKVLIQLPCNTWNAHPFVTPLPSSWYSRCCCSTERLNEAVASRVSSAHRLWRRWTKGWDVKSFKSLIGLFSICLGSYLSKSFQLIFNSFFPMWEKNMEQNIRHLRLTRGKIIMIHTAFLFRVSSAWDFSDATNSAKRAELGAGPSGGSIDTASLCTRNWRKAWNLE